MKPNTLKSPPIHEAIIQFNVELKSGVELEEIKSKIQLDSHTNVTNLTHQNIAINEDNNEITTHHFGFAFKDKANTMATQFCLDKYSCSQIATYSGWDNLVQEFKKSWDIYVQHFCPIKITQISTRFINRMEIPYEKDTKLEDYIVCLLPSPKDLSDIYLSFDTSLQLVDEEKDFITSIKQRMLQPEPSKILTQKTCIPYILDIDAVRRSTYELDDKNIYTVLELLHEHKNTVFFNSVTELLLAPYK